MSTARPRGRPRKATVPTFIPPRPGTNTPSARHSPNRQRWLNAKALADHAPASITLPEVSSAVISDDALGLCGGDTAQDRAEQAIRHASHARLREAETARSVNVEVPDEALVVLPDDPMERGILRELRRLTGLPPLAGLAE